VRGQHAGRVVTFDADRGLGEVEEADGVRRAFHCTQVADGSRAVPVGAAVRYVLVPTSLGVWEASEVLVVPDASAGDA
jgi:hypothetical protein